MFDLRVFAYPGSEGTFFYQYPLSTKRLEVDYNLKRTNENPECTWKIDLLFRLIIPDQHKRLERSATLFGPFSDSIVLCFGKEPIARDHFADIDPDFPCELLEHLKGEGLIDISPSCGDDGEDFAYFSSRRLKQ